MMIQPFVENAIIHGIKNKEGVGSIKIDFHTKKNLLLCEITDDGVGREKAKENKKQKPSKHKSTGIAVTLKRLEQFKNQTGMAAGIDIVDLKDNKNNPSGTKVIISLPYETF